MKEAIIKLLDSKSSEDVILGFNLMRTQLSRDEIYSLMRGNKGGFKNGRAVIYSHNQGVKYFLLVDRKFRNKWVILDYCMVFISSTPPYKFGTLKAENLGNHEYTEVDT